MSQDKAKLNIGVLSAGGFASFAARTYMAIDGVKVLGVCDINQDAANQLAHELGATQYVEYEAMLSNPLIDLIYIGTPPHLHYQHSKLALEAGKHVICEKPAALHTAEAEELAAYARENQLLYVVNLMQRYNPLYLKVKAIVDQAWLGNFVHGFFENYASDQALVPSHWFWDEAKSGGIFIEHAVHFFDMFSGWFGTGELMHAFELQRAGWPQITDRVQAIVLYDGHPVNFYHGFNQPKLLDHQEMRLQFEHGDITLYEWVPVKIRIHGLMKLEHLEELQEMFPDATLEFHGKQGPQQTLGSFKPIEFDAYLTLVAGNIEFKMERYAELVRDLLIDQWAWIQDRSHRRLIDDTNAIESLR
ncbi:MAG: Gfo/Idh/MocA family oxidoreductase, partial [Saprospiraceae bacterium]